MTDFCCCDSADFVAETIFPVKRKQLSLGKPSKKAALLPSKRFENTVSEKEVKKYRRPPKVASLQILQEALDGHFVPFKNGLISKINVSRRNALGTSLANHTLLM